MPKVMSLESGEMAQWVKARATKPDLSEIPGTYMVEPETGCLRVLFSLLYACVADT